MDIKFPSETSGVRGVVQKILDFVGKHNPTNEAKSDLRLVFSELLYNAVVHGNKNDPQKNVFVRINIAGSVLHAQIQDEGQGFNFQKVVKHANSEEALLYEDSRGMILINGLTENLSFNEAGNVIQFEKRLK